MADNTIIQQGRFTSTGAVKTLAIRSDVDWFHARNITVAGASQTTAIGVEYFWQRGFPQGAMIEYLKSNAANAANLEQYLTTGGFTLIDSSATTPGASIAVTAGTNATQPVYSTANTGTLATGSIVRLSNLTGQEQLASIDFEVDTVVANTSFRMRYVLDSAPGAAATAGFWRLIPFDPIFYPRRRYIINITNAASAVVTLSVTHGYTVGQEVRFNVPAVFEMVEMNGLSGIITAINTTTNTITVNIDSTAFTAFDIPEASQVPLTWAQVVPFGEDTGTALTAATDILADATLNSAILGIQLAAGANSPAGQTNDVIYWIAGKSFSVDNQ